MSTARQFSSLAGEDGGDRSDTYSINFGMNPGAADPSAAYDDPGLWCHLSATPEAVIVPSQNSGLASVQAHHIPPQHGPPYQYAAQVVYGDVPSYQHLQPGSVHSMPSRGTSDVYHAQQSTSLHKNQHIHTNATVPTPSGNLVLTPGQAVSPLGAFSLSKSTSQGFASPQLRSTGVVAGVQQVPELHARSATTPYPSFPPSSLYHDLTIPPLHFAEQNSATTFQYLDHEHTFPDPSSLNASQSQHLSVHHGVQRTKSLYSRSSHHSHSPYSSSPSISPTPSFISSLQASPVLPAITHSEAATSRSASSRSSSATSSPFSPASHLQTTATPSPPSSCTPLSAPKPGSDAPRFACRLCPGGRTFSRTKDLERHVQSIHDRDPHAPRWICCGVPLSEADRWALPDWVRREPPYMLNGVPMVGGCKEHCSRKDVLKRHLRKNESRCFGSENAPWLPGNQVCKRAPRGAGNGAAGGAGSGGVVMERS